MTGCYAVSALHLLISIDPAQPPGPGVVTDMPDLVAKQGAIDAILAWRAQLSAKYRAQLTDALTWDESSPFAQSQPVAPATALLLAYLAAALDQQGPALIRTIRNTTRPDDAILRATFAESTRRGFAGRFPQLLLGSSYWFPFDRHLVIEEPDWRGAVQRYGSLPQLAAELQDLRDFIPIADPRATLWPASRPETPTDTLAAAWQASDTLASMCALAGAKRLPLCSV